MANKNIRSLSSRKELDDNLFENIATLSKQNASKEEFQALAKRFLIDDSVVVGTSSFYDFTREENRNKKIHVCSGTACMVAKSQSNLYKNLKNHFKEDEIGHAACVGHCHSNSAFMYNDKTYSAHSKEELEFSLHLVSFRLRSTSSFRDDKINSNSSLECAEYVLSLYIKALLLWQ